MKKLATLLLLALIAAGCGSPKTADDAGAAFLKKYASQLSKTQQLKYVGPTVKPSDKIHEFGAHISDQATVRVSEARKVFVTAVEHFLKMANESTTLTAHVVDPPLTPDRLFFVLTFWTEDMKHPGLPFVAQMQLKNGMIEYLYTKKGTNEVVEDGPKERYEAARRSVMHGRGQLK